MALVLIIDDDPIYSAMLCRQVERIGHKASCAQRLGDGIRRLEAGDVDIVLLDVNLPDGSGLTAIGQMRSSTSHPEVIVITGAGDAEGAELAIRGGAWDYLKKRHSFEELALPLSTALQFRKEKAAVPPVRALDLCGIIGNSPLMKTCYDLLAHAASCDANVLISGETGTGKELFAQAIHTNSPRRDKNFVVVDCAALPEHLIESTLFGHYRGSFTGAVRDQLGLIAQADQGTLFLDEIGEMPLPLQKAFLRVLQERRFRAIGSTHEERSDFRLVAATNRDLAQMVRDATFREDLLFRVRSLVIQLPPLRERAGDIGQICQAMIARICERQGTGTKGMSPGFLDALEGYDWPGNVRELEHALNRAVAMAAGQPTLYPAHLPGEIRVRRVQAALLRDDPSLRSVGEGEQHIRTERYPTPRRVLDAAMESYLRNLMADAGGDIETACRLAKLSRSRLYQLLKQHKIPRASQDDH